MVCGNCSKVAAAQICSRCKMMTYCNRECQVAHWRTHKSYCESIELSPQKLHFVFNVGRDGPPITFEEDMPALFRRQDAPRDLTSRWVTDVADSHEEEVLARSPGSLCVECGKPAVRLYTTLIAALTADQPTVFVTLRAPSRPQEDIYRV
ncbi:hypothetical protein DFH06DRAFT_1479491 [Mycena polygramma]|nr:hypothetical protein DFH06DRAFT_1479491 [Mycena polygramma]